MSYTAQLTRPGSTTNANADPSLWQQQGGNPGYGQDSGIQSGANTGGPGSLTGHENDNAGIGQDGQVLYDMDQGYPQGYTQQEVDGKEGD